MYVDDVTIEQIPNFPIFSINPISKDYGTIVAGNSVSQDFTISNSGAGTLTINDGGITLTVSRRKPMHTWQCYVSN